MTVWAALWEELDAWQAIGRAPAVWWRDDDAAKPCAALDQLMALSEAQRAPLALAVVPERNILTADHLGALTTPLQHGYAHRSHAGPDAKKCELGPERRADHVIGELMAGRDALDRAFGPRLLPVMVPPWNRLAGHLRVMLPELGYCGLSQFGPRSHPAIGAMRCVNTHVDIIDWKGTRGFVGEAAAVQQMIDHLRQRREEQADPDEATGVLTHHLVHDPACWAFLETLFEVIADSTIQWADAPALFGDAE